MNYDLVILGATLTGLGAAYSYGGNILVIERLAQVGYEYANSFNTGIDWNDITLSAYGADFKKDLVERGILSADGKAHIPALQPVLFNMIKCDKLPVLLMTEVVSINYLENHFNIVISNNSGISQITAKMILDTTQGILAKQNIISKSINAVLYSSISEQPPYAYDENSTIVEGKLFGEYILKLKLSPNDDWIVARKKLHDYWSSRPKELNPWTIVAVADCFEVKINKSNSKINDKYFHIPSCNFKNPLEAFEAGINFFKGVTS